MNAYKETINSKGLTLIMDGRIVWKHVRLFIDFLSKNEWTYITREYTTREKYRPHFRDNKDTLMSLPSTDRVVEQYINPSEAGWEIRYYRALFGMRISNEERRKEVCLNYLEGLEWTFNYYRSDCADWRWTYKYDYPPLLVDLIKYIPYFDAVLLPKKERDPVTPHVQLGYVLPKQNLWLIPNDIGNRLLTSKPEWFNDKCEFQWAFCKYFWEAHVKLPEICLTDLEKAVTEESYHM
jgi:5'-3' exonuclease